MKIAILVGNNPYQTTAIFAKSLARAWKELECKVDLHYVGEGYFFHAFYEVLEDPPDLTFSFSDIRGLNWSIPHFTFALDPVIYYLHQRGLLSCVDAKEAELTRTHFLPHAYEPFKREKKERIFETVFFGTCFDLDEIEEEWKRHPKRDFLYAAAEAVLYGSASILEVAHRDMELHLQVDRYVRAFDRIQLCKQFSDLTIWGEGPWKKYLPHAKVFPAISFQETLDVMQQAQCVLNSSPRIKQGLHERILYAAYCGCRVISAHNDYVKGYPQGKWAEAPGTFSEVLGEHTWEERAKEIIQLSCEQ